MLTGRFIPLYMYLFIFKAILGKLPVYLYKKKFLFFSIILGQQLPIPGALKTGKISVFLVTFHF